MQSVHIFMRLSSTFAHWRLGLLSALAGRVIVTAQKDTAGDHAGTFLATWAFNGHSEVVSCQLSVVGSTDHCSLTTKH